MINNLKNLPPSLKDALLKYQKNEIESIQKAYNFAHTKHLGQFRSSGDDYIIHPVRIATNLAKANFDATTIIAGLLHDLVEDTSVSLEEIADHFGHDVKKIVDGVTKVSSYKIKDKSKVFSDNSLFLERVENYKKILFAATKDARVLIVKLYDRLDNVETIRHLPEHKQKFYARETIAIFAPIAERLGMNTLKSELEDKAFPYAYREECKSFMAETRNSYKNAEIFINSIIPFVKNKTEKSGIKIVSIAGRAKSHYSLYKKIERKGSLSNIHDILALRIIVHTIPDCYEALSLVHSLYEPLPGKIKDYIARPKINGYQSIHSTVKDKDGNIFEVQIRTKKMHEEAEFGHIAHWNYKENSINQKTSSHTADWIAELEKLQTISSKKEFLKELKENLFAHQVFIFTPKGDIHKLPEGSTPIDFAYAIHTSLGHRTTGAKVNNKIVPLSTQLATGDIVEIIAGKILNPKEDWLTFVKTTSARHKIKTLTKISHESSMAEVGLKKIKDAITKNNLPPLNKEDAFKLLKDSRIPYKTLDKAFVSIAEGNFGIIKFLKIIYPNFKTTETRHLLLDTESKQSIPALKNIPHEFAKCCKPNAGSVVIGYIGKEPVIKIHRQNCKKLKNVDRRRLISLS